MLTTLRWSGYAPTLPRPPPRRNERFPSPEGKGRETTPYKPVSRPSLFGARRLAGAALLEAGPAGFNSRALHPQYIGRSGFSPDPLDNA